jgi:hypothetical protein
MRYSIKLRAWIVAVSSLIALAAMASTADEPHDGEILHTAIAAAPLDRLPHQEQTCATMITAGLIYNTLRQFSPTDSPEIIDNLAAFWAVSADGLTCICTRHNGPGECHPGALAHTGGGMQC